MPAPAWFICDVYVANKLAQLQAADPAADWTGESLQAAFAANGYSNDADGMYRHFVEWGNAENVSPSPWFVVSEYMVNKLAQIQRHEPAAGWDMAKVEQAFRDAGLSAWDHYTLYGQAEGLDPSSFFDTNAYLAAKLAQLQRDEPDGGWTSAAQVVEAFQANGLNPIEHYLLYGINEALSYTPVEPVAPEKPVTDELTTARDVLRLGAGDHVIGGVASTLSAEKTLNENDRIDGGEGNDTLRVTMNANFNGFTVTDDPDTTGGMTNVENVELINNGFISRTFSARGSEGVTAYTLKGGEAGTGVVNLKDLSAAGITVNVEGLQSGKTSVDFASGALDGTADGLTLGLTNVGTAPAAAGDEPIAVNVSTSSGLESVTITASGPNYVNLSGVDAPSLAMTGSGALTITGVHAALEAFDGSAATGNVTADLSAADEIQALVGTRGDDTFTVKNLSTVAVLDGGAGNDTLWLDGVDGTLQPTLSGFETIGVRDNTQLILFGQNAKDFSAVSLEGASVTLTKLNASTVTVNSLGEADGGDTANAAALSDAVRLTVNVEAAAAAASQNITTAIKASKATDAVINVGANVLAQGAFTLVKAQSVQLNVTGSEGISDEQAGFNAQLVANSATDLSVTAGADVTLGAGSRLDTVQSLNITQSGIFDTGGIDFAALNSLNVSGSGRDAKATFGDLGDARNAYGLTATAAGLAAGLELGDVATQDDVTLDFANVTGKVTTGTISGNNVNVRVARLGQASDIASKTGILATGNVTVDASDNLAESLSIGAITLQDNGSTTVKTNAAVSVTVDGSADLFLNTINAADAARGMVTLDLSGYWHDNADVDGPEITGNTVNVYGSELLANNFNNITANTLTFTGGLGNDLVDLNGFSGTDITATLNTGAGNDTVTIDGIATTKTITVSGDMGGDANDAITIDASVVTVHGVKIDISKLGGYSTSKITGVNHQSDTIIGGSGDDEIKAGDVSFDSAICDTLTGGDGADIFMLHTATGSQSKEDGPTTIITDFDESEGDELHIGSIGAGTSTNYVEDTTTYTSLGDLLAAADDKLDGTTFNYFAAMFGNDTYIVGTNSLTTLEHEIIVQLQGVSLDQLDDSGSFIKALTP